MTQIPALVRWLSCDREPYLFQALGVTACGRHVYLRYRADVFRVGIAATAEAAVVADTLVRTVPGLDPLTLDLACVDAALEEILHFAVATRPPADRPPPPPRVHPTSGGLIEAHTWYRVGFRCRDEQMNEPDGRGTFTGRWTGALDRFGKLEFARAAGKTPYFLFADEVRRLRPCRPPASG